MISIKANEEYFACAWTTIDDKSENTPKVLLAAGGERGVIRILDVNRKSQHAAVRNYSIKSKFHFYHLAFTNRCH